MKTSRRDFLSGVAASSLLAMAGCRLPFASRTTMAKVGLQLYSVRAYIAKVGIAKALKEIAAIGYQGVEFAGYYGKCAAELKAMLLDSGLEACGTHVTNAAYGFNVKEWKFDADKLKATAEFELAYGNVNVICPGGGNFPPGANWSTGRDGKAIVMTEAQCDFTKRLAELYNRGAVEARRAGIRIGLHNHTWEHKLVFPDGTSFWDYFWTHTDRDVCIEQDVGWTTCAGVDPCETYVKYPHRSPTLHAKENGMGPLVKEFDAILGQPGQPGAVPVDWDRLFPVTDADGVEWYVVECERHENSLDAVKPSFDFLRSKGRV